jgi:magnesium-transporting ATPase (P-type)
MTVVSLVMIETIGKSLEVVEHEVEGTSYYPFGNVFGVEKEETKKYPDGAVSDIMAVSFGCNDSKLIDAKDGCSIIGDPTEGALLTCAEKLGVQEAAGMQVEKNRQEWNDLWERYITLDFDRKRKSMSTFCRHKNTGAERLLVKGAPDLLLKRCSFLKGRDGTIAKLSLEMRNNVENMISELGSRPLRCLLLATKEVSHDQYKDELKNAEKFVSIESGLTMVGLVGIKDPPRTDAKESISLCKHAGIRVMMMTGDAKDTATAIAKELDMLPCGPNETSHVFEGKDFFSLSKEDQRSLLSNGNLVLARTEATDKQLLLKMLQSLGEVPAMTGDGVNDAPALRQASIGKMCAYSKFVLSD